MTEQELVDLLAASGRGDDLLALLDKLGFKRSFVAERVLSSASPVTVSQIAMLWMGMPNKHDRKRTRQLFEALADAGLLVKADDSGDVYAVKM